MLSIRLTVALNHEEIKNDPPKIAKIKSVIDEYNWKGTNFSSEKDDWKKIEEDNRRTALTDSYYKRIYIYIYIYILLMFGSIIREKQVILLMILVVK